MIISIDKQLIENSLFFISKAISKSKISGQYANVQVVVNSGKLYLYSSNGNILCESFCSNVDAEDLVKVVEFQLLDKVVSLSSEDTINLNFRDDALYVKEKKSEYKIMYGAPYDYSRYFSGFDKNNDKICEVPLDALCKAISFTSACIPPQSSFQQLHGVYFDGNIVTTNSKAISVYEILKKGLGGNSFFLSADSAGILGFLYSESGMASFHKFSDRIIVCAGDVSYILSILNNKFPDYSKILAKIASHTFSTKVPREEITKACKRLVSFTDTYRRNSAKLTFDKTSLSIEVLSESKSGKEIFETQESNIVTEVSFSVNLVDFNAYISGSQEDYPKITFGESLSEYCIKNESGLFTEVTLD